MNLTPKMYKEQYPFLCDADSSALCTVWKDLKNAYKNYFKIESTRYPKFKSENDKLFKYTTYSKGKLYGIRRRNKTMGIQKHIEFIKIIRISIDLEIKL